MSPFLNIGTMLACRQSSGIRPASSDVWNMDVNIGASWSALSCNSLAGISSGPVALLTLTFFQKVIDSFLCHSDAWHRWVGARCLVWHVRSILMGIYRVELVIEDLCFWLCVTIQEAIWFLKWCNPLGVLSFPFKIRPELLWVIVDVYTEDLINICVMGFPEFPLWCGLEMSISRTVLGIVRGSGLGEFLMLSPDQSFHWCIDPRLGVSAPTQFGWHVFSQHICDMVPKLGPCSVYVIFYH